MSQHASIYRRRGKMIACPVNLTTAGVWLACPPFVVVDEAASPGIVGALVADALRQSGRRVDHPHDWKAVAAPRLQAAGVKSERAFHMESHLVHVASANGSISFVPTMNCGTSGDNKGFTDKESAKIVIAASSSSEELGKATITAFNECE